MRALPFKIAYLVAAMAAAVLFTCPAASYAEDGIVGGRAVYMGEPVADAMVYAYDSTETLFSDRYASAPVFTGKDGEFRMVLPAGGYYLTVVKKKSGEGPRPEPGELYAYYGGNPVISDPQRKVEITVSMMVKPAPVEPGRPQGKDSGEVAGRVTFGGKPLPGAVVFAFRNTSTSFHGMGDYRSRPTGEDGSFDIGMDEGVYYLVARKRRHGGAFGPLRMGDYFAYPDGNPFTVAKGVVLNVEIPAAEKFENMSPGGHGQTVLAGTIRDSKSRPVAGVYACLYGDAAMVDRPVIISEPSGPDGKFSVELPKGGCYYLAARGHVGGKMEKGDYAGTYEGSPDHSVCIQTGVMLDGMDITVEVTEGEHKKRGLNKPSAGPPSPPDTLKGR